MAIPKIKGLQKTAIFVWDDSASTYKAWQGIDAGSLIPDEYDAINLDWSGGNITGVNYYTGGTAGTLVTSLTIAYVAGSITTILRV